MAREQRTIVLAMLVVLVITAGLAFVLFKSSADATGIAGGVEQTPPVASADATSPPILPGGMTLISQPEGYTSSVIRVSPDGRLAAFISIRDDVSQVIVVDRRTGQVTIAPAPAGPVFEMRQITHLAWSGDGRSLYVIERASDGVTSRDAWLAMSGEARAREIADSFEIVYTWRIGDAECVVLNEVRGMVLDLATSGSSAWVVAQPRRHSALNVSEFQDGRLVYSRAVQVMHRGKRLPVQSARLLPLNRDLWFIASQSAQLGMVKLGAEETEATLLEGDFRQFAWTPDEQTLIAMDITGLTNAKFQMFRRGAMDDPVTMAVMPISMRSVMPAIAGFDADGQTIYLRSLADPSAGLAGRAPLSPMALYSFELPQ